MQRNAVKSAAKAVGFSQPTLLNEPTAAALAYGLNQNLTGWVMVYDLGGGTFDVSILKLQDQVLAVQAVGGDTQLGGDDVDALLLDYCLKQLHINPDQLTRSTQITYLQAVKLAKEGLTHNDTQTINFGNATIEVSRLQFEAIIDVCVEQTMHICRQALKDAEGDAECIESIVLVGGSSRIPLIAQKLAAVFGKHPLCSIDPDQAVAIGAAIHADQLQTQAGEIVTVRCYASVTWH